jgi:PAS domain S-box-containing protein
VEKSMTIFNKIFTAPTFDDEVKTQQAYMLHIILWALICVPIPFVIYTLLLKPDNLSRTLLQATFGETVNIILLFMLHRGYVKAASILQVTAFWFFFTVTAFTGNGVQSEAYLLGYGMVIAISGILLGGRGASVFTILSITAGGWMVFGQMQGISNFGFDNSPLTTWVVSLVLFPVGAILQYLASRTTRIALSRAQASEEKYRLISQVSSDYTFVTDVSKDGSGSLSWVAGAFEKMTGFTYEEYVATGGWLAHVHPDDLEKDAEDMGKLLANQNVMSSDIRTFTKSGEIRWERIFAHPIWNKEENRLARIVGAVQDLTIQKRSEEMLKETLLQQNAILNSIPDLAWLKNKNGQYVAVNEQFAATTGKRTEDIIGKTDFEIWDIKFATKYHNDDLEVMRSGQRKQNIEELQTDSTGREYWVETSKTPILNEQKEVIGTTGIAREITERKKAELERETLITELEAKNAELERYTYTVSHDLKSPLVTIRGFLGYLEKDVLAGNIEKVKEDIKRIENATKKMHALLNDLLELSRIGRLINQPTDTLFTDIAKDAISLVQGQIEAKNVLIEIHNTPAIVHGDRTRLTEVIQNLVDNAVKFMGDQPKPHITIGAITNEKNEIVFFVRDNGVGIDSQYHERIFTLFGKLSADTEGTGIGLTLVRRIVEVHQGRIWLESEPGKGTTFYFTLNQT